MKKENREMESVGVRRRRNLRRLKKKSFNGLVNLYTTVNKTTI